MYYVCSGQQSRQTADVVGAVTGALSLLGDGGKGRASSRPWSRGERRDPANQIARRLSEPRTLLAGVALWMLPSEQAWQLWHCSHALSVTPPTTASFAHF